jgi:hypothetical protein
MTTFETTTRVANVSSQIRRSFLPQGAAKVFDHHNEMEWVSRTCLKLGEPQVEVSSLLIGSVDQERSDADNVCSGIHALESIDQQGASQTLTLF